MWYFADPEMYPEMEDIKARVHAWAKRENSVARSKYVWMSEKGYLLLALEAFQVPRSLSESFADVGCFSLSDLAFVTVSRCVR